MASKSIVNLKIPTKSSLLEINMKRNDQNYYETIQLIPVASKSDS